MEKLGNFYTDPEYQMFIDACEYLGIPYGFYFLDEALDSIEIDKEVEFIKDFVEKHRTQKGILPIAIDLEYQDGKGRADDVWETRCGLVNELIEKLKEVNEEVIVYVNYQRAKTYLKDLKVNLWVAYYPKDNKIPEQWMFDEDLEIEKDFLEKIIGWQFTEDGAQRDEIKTKVDLSLVKNQKMNNLNEKGHLYETK